MTAAFGGTDAEGLWDWKSAYDVCEVVQILFLRKFGSAIRTRAAYPTAELAMHTRIASLFPSHTRRSEESQAFQQFSTPVTLGLAASTAAAITSGDRVLEPSAGTGLLAILAEIAGGAAPGKVGAAAIDRALGAVQDVVVADFKIGKQKPVDMLAQYRRTGWGHLWLLCDGLTDEERKLLPFRYVGKRGEDPQRRLQEWVREQETHGKPTYLIVDDPTYWIQLKGA